MLEQVSEERCQRSDLKESHKWYLSGFGIDVFRICRLEDSVKGAERIVHRLHTREVQG